MLIVDLKLVGNDEGTPVDAIARDAEPWFMLGFVLLFLTGVPQLISNALREYYSIFFWIKMVVMVLALVFTFTIRRRVTLAPDGAVSAGPRASWWGGVDRALGVGGDSRRLIGLFTRRTDKNCRRTTND